jgi:hypothetical protein
VEDNLFVFALGVLAGVLLTIIIDRYVADV